MKALNSRMRINLTETKLTNTNIVILFNIILAAIAFLKDILLAAYFGTTQIADELLLAFFIPDTFANMLLGAAIGVSCIPIFTKLNTRDDENYYYTTISKVLFITFTISMIILILLLTFSTNLFQMLASNESIRVGQSRSYFFIMSSIIFLAPLGMVAASILQAKQRFIIPALVPILLNGILLFILLFNLGMDIPRSTGSHIFAYTVSVATLFCTIFSWYFVYKNGISLNRIVFNFFPFNDKWEEARKISTIFIPYIIILGFIQIIYFVERYVALKVGTGTMAGLTYAFRVSQFPIWVFVAAINTVLLPSISKLIEENHQVELKREIIRSFKFLLVITGSISIILFLFGEQILSLLLMRGAFDEKSLAITNAILKGYTLSIVGQSINLFCTRYFIAEGQMRIPFLVNLFGCLLHIVLLFTFVPIFGETGIGLSAAITYTISGCLIFTFFHKKLLTRKGREQNHE